MTRLVEINGRAVETATIEVAGIDHHDYPDYADAYVTGAQYADGEDLSDDDLELLQDQYPDVIYDVIAESAIGQADYYNDMIFDR